MKNWIVKHLAPWTRGIDKAIDHWQTEDIITHDIAKMLNGVVAIAHMQVKDIMISESMMCTIDINTPHDQIMSMIIETGHSRFPLIDHANDKALGVVMAKDLLKVSHLDQAYDLNSIARPVKIIPETRSLSLLLREFRLSHKHMAVVINEYGSISGLVTIEDVLEQIVGDIEDEFDAHHDFVIDKIGKHLFDMNALTPIEYCNQQIGTVFNEGQYETMAGLIMHELGRLPKRDEVLNIQGSQITITNVDSRRIKQIEVHFDKKEP